MSEVEYMTTKQFIESVEALGLRAKCGYNYGISSIDVYEEDRMIAYVDTDNEYVMTVRKGDAGGNRYSPLFKIMCTYASTPVGEREPKTYKLKILGADPQLSLYLIYINEHETTVTTNKKAAKAYSKSGVYNAKELAEKQGFALRAEVVDADD